MRETAIKQTQKLVTAAVFSAIIFCATVFLKIPGFWGGSGYIHLGDAFIFLACFYLGGWYAVAGAVIGSVLADLAAGWVIYMPATAVVKVLMPVVVLLIGGSFKSKLRMGIAFGAGALVMAFGYFFADLILAAFVVGEDFTYAATVANIPFNILQGFVGVPLAFGVVVFAKRLRLFPKRETEHESAAEEIKKT